MRNDFSGENDIKFQKNAILKPQIVGCIGVAGGVYAATGDTVALVSAVFGGLAMTTILFLFASFAEVLLEGISVQEMRESGEGDLLERQEGRRDREYRAQEGIESEEEGPLLVEEDSPSWSLTPKGMLAILLIPLKFLVLLIPLFLFRSFGQFGLAYFVAGLLLSPLLPLFLLVRGRVR